MDSLTHIALGACIGEITLGRKLGRSALVWGAIAASLPDIDAIAGLFLTLPEELVAHRGITHSLLFAGVMPFILTYLCTRWYQQHNISYTYYLSFFLLQILLHDLLDTCNAYGTGLLEPFSSTRLSFNILYVADPLFSIWLIIAATFIFLYRKNRLYQRRMAAGALILSSVYLGISINNKMIAKNHLTASLGKQTINATDYFITPTPFNNMLWYGVATTDSGYLVGHLSVFDDKKQTVPFNYFARNEHLLDSVENKEEVEKLKEFASGYYTVEKWTDTLVFNVLRFGQMIGWQEPKAHFAFHYFLNPDYNNELVVQRGRFEGWNNQTLNFMYRRIKGSIEEENPTKIKK